MDIDVKKASAIPMQVLGAVMLPQQKARASREQPAPSRAAAAPAGKAAGRGVKSRRHLLLQVPAQRALYPSWGIGNLNHVCIGSAWHEVLLHLCCFHMQVAVLCWMHSVIGWGFFLFSFWIPAYLGSLGLTGLGSMGALSALPWAVSCHGRMHSLPFTCPAQV